MLVLNPLAYSRLRNDEFLGLHKLFIEKTDCLSVVSLKPFIERYANSIEDYRRFVEVNLEQTLAKNVQSLIEDRNRVYCACVNFVKSLKGHPDAGCRETGELLLQIFREYPNPIHFNQAQATGVYDKLLASLRAVDKSRVDRCGFSLWLDNLESMENAYLEATRKRGCEDSALATRKNYLLRKNCLDCFKDLVNLCVSGELMTGNAEFVEFMDSLNREIENKKVQLKIRKTRSDNKKNGETPQESNENVA